MDEKTKQVPVEPTAEMLIAGRKQCMQDMLGAHMGPNIENIWRAMVQASRVAKARKP
jgi:hypothetical protein